MQINLPALAGSCLDDHRRGHLWRRVVFLISAESAVRGAGSDRAIPLLENVPLAEHGVDGHISVPFQFLPQTADMDIYGPRFRIIRIAPDSLEQIGSREAAPGVPFQHFEQVFLFAGKP